MERSTCDPCLLIYNRPTDEFALVGMQTDDTLILSTVKFDTIENEELIEGQLEAKDKTKLTRAKYLDFNGARVSMSRKHDGAVHIS